MSERTRRFLHLAALWAFPLALWLLATAWYGFDLGKYSDDWALSLRIPEADAYAWPASPFIRWDYFWRPLHLISVYGLATIFWHLDWVNHAISALAHLGVGVLLYRALRRFDSSTGVAICVVSLFLTFPLHHEAVLWPAALGSVVSTALMLWLVPWCGDFASRPADGKPWRTLAGMGALAFVIACWHEQAAAGVAALPLVYMARAPLEQSWRVCFRRSGLVAVACGIGCAAYVALLTVTAPSGRRGSIGNVVESVGVEARFVSIVAQVCDWLLGSRCVDVSIIPAMQGWREMSASGTGLVGIALLCGTALCWACLWWKSGDATHKSQGSEAERRSSRRRWLILFGVLGGVACFIPIAITRNNPVYARYFYPAAACAAFALAALVEGALDVAARVNARVRWGVGGVLGVIAIAAALGSAVSMLDWQRAYREQFNRDREIGGQLRALVPSPPRGAVFVPIRIDGAALERARTYPNGRVPGALTQPWSSWAFVQRMYGRSDISATHVRPERRPSIAVEEKGVRALRGVCDAWGRVDDGRAVVPWAQVVAYEIDERGNVRLLTHEEVVGRMSGSAATE